MRHGSDDMPDRAATPEATALRGSNQSGMRAHNEKLVLSLVRGHGALARSDIARMTGLSAQTVSVIMRGLEADGLLLRLEPVRGRIGQPSVPMALAADGAFFFGLKIGRRSADLILVDFLGQVVGERRETYRYPMPDGIVGFVKTALPALRAALPAAAQARIMGLGIAMPFQLWNWMPLLGAPQADMNAWRDRDIAADIAAFSDLPVSVQNDATAACGAELVFGTGPPITDFLYFYIGYFVGGGIALNGQLYTGRTGNAGAMGPMPVPGPDGRMQHLLQAASMASLEGYLNAAGLPGEKLWDAPVDWQMPAAILTRWVRQVAAGLAHAILSATSVIDFDTVLIDGWFPPGIRRRVTEETGAALAGMDLSGIVLPRVCEGTVGHRARALGAAAIPLSQRYLADQRVLLREA